MHAASTTILGGQRFDKLGDELQAALQAVQRATALCQAVGAETDVLKKEDRSPVTVADFGSQALICRELAQCFPDDPIVGEEDAAALREPGNRALLQQVTDHVGRQVPGSSTEEVCQWIDRGLGAATGSRFWTLDPIDGTKGFLRNDQYAVALCLLLDGAPALAALACPRLLLSGEEAPGVVLVAVRGRGAFQLTTGPWKKDPQLTPIRVSDEQKSAKIRFCESVEAAHSSHDDAARIADLLGIQAAPVRIDSQAKYAVVARGEAEAYLRLPRGDNYRERIWDHAAGALVVTEAGGQVTDIAGNSLDFTQGRRLERNRGVVVSDSRVHQALLDAISRLGLS